MHSRLVPLSSRRTKHGHTDGPQRVLNFVQGSNGQTAEELLREPQDLLQIETR